MRMSPIGRKRFSLSSFNRTEAAKFPPAESPTRTILRGWKGMISRADCERVL